MSRELITAIATADIGQGNLLAALSAQHQLLQEGIQAPLLLMRNPLTMAAAWEQARTTNSEKKRAKYNQKYDQVRNSLPASLLGLLNLLQLNAWLSKNKVDHLILTQESPLVALQKFQAFFTGAFIHQLKQIDILVPDVHPKSGAIKVARQQTNTKLLVWNNSAYQELQRDSVPSELVSPWLLDSHATLPTPSRRSLPLHAIRPSGTGINPEYLQALSGFLRDIGSFYINYRIYATREPQSLMQLHQQIASDQADNLFSYPSEFIQFLMQLYAIGYTGQHFSLPPRGQHEVSNAKYAELQGISRALELIGGRFAIQSEKAGDTKPDTNAIRAELGQKKLAEVVLT